MEGETSKASFLGVGLTMLVAVIVIGLAIFAVARGVMNNAQTSFVQTMDGASNAGLSDFDGTTVSGVKVRAALDDYQGKNYCILVNTAAMQRAAHPSKKAEPLVDNAVTTNYKQTIKTKESYGTNNTALQCVEIFNRAFVIYNAQLAAGANFTDTGEGYIECDGLFATDGSGTIKFNVQKINWKTSGCTEFINNSSNFTCKLIKDKSKTIMGIMFCEVY